VRIGIFGGSFDPVHHGHLILARDAMESLGLDEVRLLPTARNPLKEQTGQAPAEHRLAMLHLAVQGEPQLIVEPLDLERPPPSYMVDTLELLRKQLPTAEFYLLIGRDNLAVFDQWKAHTTILQMARLVVFGRSNAGPTGMEFPHLTLDRCLDFSATEIRERVANGRSIRYLIPEAVLDYIAQHALYLP